jgi:tetratricopeptide (TPR) repeat protein
MRAMWLTAILVVFPLAAQADTREEIAKKHYELGAKLYEASSYGEALAEFEKAYKLKPLPALLFNIARCQEVMGQLDRAITSYERYLRELADAKDRSLIETRIANLKKTLADRQPGPDPAPAPKAPSPPGSPAPTPDPTPRTWRSTAGWITLGVGAASLAVGIATGVLAKSKATEYGDGVASKLTYAELDEIDRSGKRLNGIAIGTLVTGGVLATAGAGLLIWDRLRRGERREEATLGFAPLVGPTVLGLSGQGRF